MARPRKNDPSQIINPILQEFAARIAKSVEKFTITRITDEVQKVLTQPVRRAPGERRRALVRCYYPGCQNIAAPRFAMFCAAKHKDISKAEKEKYRATKMAERTSTLTARRAEAAKVVRAPKE